MTSGRQQVEYGAASVGSSTTDYTMPPVTHTAGHSHTGSLVPPPSLSGAATAGFPAVNPQAPVIRGPGTDEVEKHENRPRLPLPKWGSD